MTDHHNNHNENDEENHDDCQDCKRQRAQNDKLIEIYEKLQEVDQRTSNIKQSVGNHKDQFLKSIQVLKNMNQKVQKIKNNKQQQNKSQFQQLGFTLFADMIEKQKRSEIQKQNQRLKQILKNIYDQRSKVNQQNYVNSVQKKSILNQTSILHPQIQKDQEKTAAQWFQKSAVTSRSKSTKSSSFRDTEMGKSFEIFSTKSSFNMTKRKNFEKKDFEELNLWLFQQRNQILEKQLYDKSLEQKNKDQNQQKNKIFLLNKSQRYCQKAKDTIRSNQSIILGSTHQRRPNNQLKKEIKDFNNSRGIYDSQMKNSYQIDTIKSVIPQHQSSRNRFHSKRTKNNSIFPSISNK